ncbi:MAG: HDOD domain-containing protein [Proteobacteria bacterium]|nr:HDOD domain-containing protein [Pseudomonadota bacterium]NIS71713.1 HDOD domain-containing protein [Pseudomonadota bacterium]
MPFSGTEDEKGSCSKPFEENSIRVFPSFPVSYCHKTHRNGVRRSRCYQKSRKSHRKRHIPRDANSALFQTIVPAATLDQGLLRIGIDKLRIMLRSLSLRDTFPMGAVGPMDYEQFWQSSRCQGLIAIPRPYYQLL